jgi:hypothetical protein
VGVSEHNGGRWADDGRPNYSWFVKDMLDWNTGVAGGNTVSSQVRSHEAVVRGDDDLIPLRRLLASASGTVVSARRGVADEVLLKVRGEGDQLWRVGSQASNWVLASSEAVLPGAHADVGAIDAGLTSLVGTGCRWLEVTRKLALVVVLDDERWLEIEADLADPDVRPDDPPYWEVFTPAGEVFSSGPGPVWRTASANEVGQPRSGERHGPVESGRDFGAYSHREVGDLLRDWTEMSAELLRRGVIQVKRSAALPADLAEELVRVHFGGFRGTFPRAGWDVLTPAGERLEVKAATQRERGASYITYVPTDDFDALVVVLFSRELAVVASWYVPRGIAEQHVSGGINAHGARSLRLSQRLLEQPGVEPIELGRGRSADGADSVQR